MHTQGMCGTEENHESKFIASILEYETFFLDFLPPIYFLIKRTVPPVFFPGKLGGSSNQFNEKGELASVSLVP